MIDLNELDEDQRNMLIQYLHQEYEKNPDEFPFGENVVREILMQYNQLGPDENESVRDIKSKEMIIEEAAQNMQNNDQDIEGGEEEIEEN